MRIGDAKLFPTCRKCGRPAPIGKVKCGRCISTKRFKTTTLKPSNKNRDKRGLCLHKPDKPRTKRAKRQFTGGMPPKGL
jgi:hypothetical protein